MDDSVPAAGLSPVLPWTVLREPVGDAHGEAQEAQVETVHVRRDGDVGEEGVVPAHEGRAAAKVFDDVEDLLTLGLPHHAPHVQQGGDVLLPVGGEGGGVERREGRRTGGYRVFGCVFLGLGHGLSSEALGKYLGRGVPSCVWVHFSAVCYTLPSLAR